MQVFTAHADDSDLAPLLAQLEESTQKKKGFKAFCAFWDEKPEALTRLNQKHHLDHVGLTLLAGANDEALGKYSVNTKNRTTVVVYKNRAVTASFVNFDPKKDMAKLREAIDAATR